MSDLIRIDVACANETEALQIAEALVSEHLAACCQLTPMNSIYRWEGAVERSEEVRLSIKTVSDRFADIEARVKALHSYTLPQITATRIVKSSADYADWLRSNSLP